MMKLSQWIILFMALPISVVAQEKEPKEKKTTFGFGIGVNYSKLHMNETPNDAVRLKGASFHLGVAMNHRLNKKIVLSPKLEISRNKNEFSYIDSNDWKWSYYVMPITINVLTHLQIQPSSNNSHVYFLVGPNVKVPIYNPESSTSSGSTVVDVAIDFGLGYSKKLTHFNFSPEIRYSLGLNNVMNSGTYGKAYMHNIILVFQFSG